MNLTTQPPMVSVIIPVFKDPRLPLCLAALARQTYGGNFEIIIVNNAPSAAVTLPPDIGRSVRLLEEGTPGSYNARNAGIAAARGEILAFTDADCVPDPNWLAAGVGSLLSDNSRGLVGGRIKVLSGNKPTLLEHYDAMASFPQREFIERQRFAATANMITRKSVMDRVGLFAGDLLSGGDFEWGRRVAQAGFPLAYCEDAIVHHPARGSYKEQLQKIRRTSAGHRDQSPDWLSCIHYCLYFLRPPLRLFRRIWADCGSEHGPTIAVAVCAITVLLRWRVAFERLRFQVTGAASPHS